LAPGPGFEPGLEESKSSVLPLDHPGNFKEYIKFTMIFLIFK
jgi:hypothetical protein